MDEPTDLNDETLLDALHDALDAAEPLADATVRMVTEATFELVLGGVLVADVVVDSADLLQAGARGAPTTRRVVFEFGPHRGEVAVDWSTGVVHASVPVGATCQIETESTSTPLAVGLDGGIDAIVDARAFRLRIELLGEIIVTPMLFR